MPMLHSNEDDLLGLLLLVGSLCCLGTWPALLRLSSWSDETKKEPPPTTTTTNDTATATTTPPSFLTRVVESWRQWAQPQRHLCHIYMDYATAYFVISALPSVAAELAPYIALTDADDDDVTNNNNNRKFAWPLILTAMVGGSLLSFGNLSFQWATAVYGTTLTTTLAVQASLTVILGTFINFLLEPQKTPHPAFLGAGVLVFLSAIVLATRAQVAYAALSSKTSASASAPFDMYYETPYQSTANHSEGDGEGQMGEPEVPADDGQEAVDLSGMEENAPSGDPLQSRTPDDAPNDDDTDTISSESTGLFAQLERKTSSFYLSDIRSSGRFRQNKAAQGLCIAIMGGVAFGFFSPAFNIAVNDPFHWSSSDSAKEEESSPATTLDSVRRANFWFCLAFWTASMLGNLRLLQNEPPGERGRGTTVSSLTDSTPPLTASETPSLWSLLVEYVTGESWNVRGLSISAGVVCALGNVLQFHGGALVGYATADLVQAYPLVSTLWDILLFGEFANLRRHRRTPDGHRGEGKSLVWLCPRKWGGSSDDRTTILWLLTLMYVAYLTGICLLAASSLP